MEDLEVEEEGLGRLSASNFHFSLLNFHSIFND